MSGGGRSPWLAAAIVTGSRSSGDGADRDVHQEGEAGMSIEQVRKLTRVASATIVALSLAASALAQDVSYNAMPGTDFSKFTTYKWVTIEGAQHPDQIVEQQIKMALDAQLAAKGLKKVDADPADLYVGYQVAVNQERQWNAYGGGMGWRVGGGMASATSSTINIGTLGVDIYNAAGKQLVWRGSATKTLDAKASPQKREENITKAVTKLLKNYPPPAK
jgi:Domain of unknown function (DUF4136)